MRPQAPKGGNNLVVNIIDQRVFCLTPNYFSYSISKAGLHAATRPLAQSLGPKGIRVNAIAPGPVIPNKDQSDEVWQRQMEASILGSGAGPDDVCDALVYFLNARSVTGQALCVDGGLHLHWLIPELPV